MQLVDSHCHLNFEPLDAELPKVLQRARDNDVAYMLCVAVTVEKFPEIRALARAHRHIFASVGVHPNERDGGDPSVQELVGLADDDRVVAIGETDLDYYRTHDDPTWQQERFRRHIRAAKQCGKPLIIHMRDATEDTIRILKEEGADEVGGVMHCFTGNWDTARRALALNFYISFSGIVTFKNAAALREVVSQVPDDRLLIETDAPYLAPMPHRGKTNEPAFVRHVADGIAQQRQTSLENIAKTTRDNFFTLFQHARS